MLVYQGKRYMDLEVHVRIFLVIWLIHWSWLYFTYWLWPEQAACISTSRALYIVLAPGLQERWALVWKLHVSGEVTKDHSKGVSVRGSESRRGTRQVAGNLITEEEERPAHSPSGETRKAGDLATARGSMFLLKAWGSPSWKWWSISCAHIPTEQITVYLLISGHAAAALVLACPLRGKVFPISHVS